MSSRFQYLLNGLLLSAVLLGSVVVTVLMNTQPLLETTSYLILLTVLYLRGPLLGLFGVFGMGLLLESVSQLPLGRMLFISSLCGLILLHLCRKTEWSAVGRGLLCCLLGGLVWRFTIDFFQWSAALSLASIGQLLWTSLSQSIYASGCWLLLAVIVSGMQVVWREVCSRPIHFGGQI